MQTETPAYTFDRVVRLLITAGVVIGLFWLLRYLSDVLLPFAIAAVLAYLLNPLVVRLESSPPLRRWRARRGTAVALTLLGAVVIGFALFSLAIYFGTAQANRFASSLNRLGDALSHAAPTDAALPAGTAPVPASGDTPGGGTTDSSATGLAAASQPAEGIPLGFAEAWETITREDLAERPLEERLKALREATAGTHLGEALVYARDEINRLRADTDLIRQGVIRGLRAGWTAISTGVSAAATGINWVLLVSTALILTIIFLIFILLDYQSYVRTWRASLPPAWRGPILEFADEFELILHRFFRGQFIIAMLTGVCFAVCFTLIGLPLAIPLGLLIGVLNMVPYLQAVAFPPALLLALLRAIEHGAGASDFLWSIGLVLGIFAAVQVLMDGILTPRIMGQATGLRPVAILLGVFIWGKLLGFLGLILAIPLTCMGIAYYRRFVLRRAEGEK